MKKNISINISGIIFHIEEDGYESLRKYLDSISKYFSTFEDSSEIMADIESRIAEIFLSKLNEGKQVITLDDVSALIATMGNVNDFKAAEEATEPQSKTSTENSTSGSSENKTQSTYSPPKQLKRDQKRKILGGVCAGIGNYFNIDPVWIRLLFALLAFAYGIAFIVYIIMWIVIPGTFDLEETQSDKKLFRDPEGKVLGGVSGGLASYFSVDIILIRVLFIALTIAGGFGVLMYIVLWVTLPEARSLTDRIQMQGEPVTLSNIESNIKKNLNVEGEKEESAVTKIILFPFRLIGMLLSALGKILVPLIDVLRVAVGILITVVGLSIAFGVLVAGGVLLGLFTSGAFSWSEFTHISFPVEIFTSSFPGWMAFAAFIGAIVPAIFVILLGISVISQRIVFGPAVGWTLFIAFFVSAALLSAGIPKIVMAFKEDGTHKVESLYTPTTKRIALHLNEVGLDDYHAVDLTIKGYDGKEIKLVQEYMAQGTTRQQAIENAQMITYNINVQDSIYTFDSNIEFKDDARFRAQRLKINLYLPYDFPFTMTEDVSRFVTNYVDYNYLDGQLWRMTPRGLDCLSCPVANGDPETREEASESFNHADFDEVEISGIFDVTITQSEAYSVELSGSEEEKNRYEVKREGGTLIIDFNNHDNFFWQRNLNDNERVKIKITMPALERIEAKGAGQIDFSDFKTNDLQLELLGAIEMDGDLIADDVTIELSGASKLELKGKSKRLEAIIQGASKLEAYEFETINADVEVNGPSKAEVNVTGTLEMEEGFVGDIDYRGNPKVLKNN